MGWAAVTRCGHGGAGGERRLRRCFRGSGEEICGAVAVPASPGDCQQSLTAGSRQEVVCSPTGKAGVGQPVPLGGDEPGGDWTRLLQSWKSRYSLQ